MMGRVVAALLVVAAAAACAQPKAPPGGEPDRSAPRVIDVTPAPFDTLRDLSRPVDIRFNERISERLSGVANLRDAVLVSPQTGAVEAHRGRHDLKVSLAGGWKKDLVYRVVVLPVLRDLFGNSCTEPIELVFSTGAPIEQTALAGFVRDRITGKSVAMARVAATRRIDGNVYVAATDTSGFFSMRHIPAGAYDVRAWLDQDRNDEAGFREPQDSTAFAIGVRDTSVLELSILPRDTTPARLVRAEPVDSTKLRLQFDDYFALGSVSGSAAVYLLPDSTFASGGSLLQSAALDSVLAVEQAAADSASAAAGLLRPEGDSAHIVADSARAAADSALVAADSLHDGTRPRTRGVPTVKAQKQAGPPLPSRELILVLDHPLVSDTVYAVTVSGVTNINGVADGGGSIRFRTPRDTTLAAAASADTAAAGAGADTTAAGAARGRVAGPDSTASGTIPRDTVSGSGGGGVRDGGSPVREWLRP